MPSRVVKQPNGKLAVFSTIVDDFTHYDYTPEELLEDLIFQMGNENAKAKLQRGLDDDMTGIGKVTASDGLNRWRDAIETIRIVHGDAKADARSAGVFE